MAPSPLSARHGSAVVWTGAGVVVVGGDTESPCPPGTDCLRTPRPATEVVAYDPVAHRWRVLPDLPVAAAGPVGGWNGTEVVVVAGGETLALDPDADAWRRLGRAPRIGDSVVPVAGGLVLVAYQQPAQHAAVDWLLDEAGVGPRYRAIPSVSPTTAAWRGTGRGRGCCRWVENHFAAHAGTTWDGAVWADAALFLWGLDFDRGVTVGLLWRPPSPD